MSNRSSSFSSVGIGFAGLLTLAFTMLKLTGYIDWSWWWVWLPMWISFLLFLVACFIFLVVPVIKNLK